MLHMKSQKIRLVDVLPNALQDPAPAQAEGRAYHRARVRLRSVLVACLPRFMPPSLRDSPGAAPARGTTGADPRSPTATWGRWCCPPGWVQHPMAWGHTWGSRRRHSPTREGSRVAALQPRSPRGYTVSHQPSWNTPCPSPAALHAGCTTQYPTSLYRTPPAPPPQHCTPGVLHSTPPAFIEHPPLPRSTEHVKVFTWALRTLSTWRGRSTGVQKPDIIQTVVEPNLITKR